MPLSARKLEGALRNKFHFEDDVGKERNHTHLVKRLESGNAAAWTKLPHHRGDLSKSLKGRIARQLHVDSSQLEAMVGCTISREEYESLLTGG